MCVIVKKPSGVTISPEVIEAMWDSNKDGAGLGWITTKNKVYYQKGFMVLDDLQKVVKKFPKNAELVLHFRQATHGSVTALNTHPFPVGEDNQEEGEAPWGLFFHNGVIPMYGTQHGKDPKSDSLDFCERVLAYLPEEEIPLILNKIQGKFIFMTAEKTHLCGVNDHYKGLTCSNLGFQYRLNDNTTKEWVYKPYWNAREQAWGRWKEGTFTPLTKEELETHEASEKADADTRQALRDEYGYGWAGHGNGYPPSSWNKHQKKQWKKEEAKRLVEITKDIDKEAATLPAVITAPKEEEVPKEESPKTTAPIGGTEVSQDAVDTMLAESDALYDLARDSKNLDEVAALLADADKLLDAATAMEDELRASRKVKWNNRLPVPTTPKLTEAKAEEKPTLDSKGCIVSTISEICTQGLDGVKSWINKTYQKDGTLINQYMRRDDQDRAVMVKQEIIPPKLAAKTEEENTVH